MPERPSTEPHPSGVPVPHPDQAAKIEQLLLTGLDAYFAGQYDLAIGVLTRVLFLDRAHARARAYIERARSALAERQRESEALLHQGVEAFRRGDRADARQLLEQALSLGAPAEEARTVLDRMHDGRPGPVPVEVGSAAATLAPPVTSTAGAFAGVRLRRGGAVLALGGSVLVACAIAALAAARAGWLPVPSASGSLRPSSSPNVRERGLALPPLGELALARARGQAAAGRLRDAMATLLEVRVSDPAKAEAERYRADLQRQLLSLTPGTSGVGFAAERQSDRP